MIEIPARPARKGEVFDWPPRYGRRVMSDAELVMSNPQNDRVPVLDHSLAKVSGS